MPATFGSIHPIPSPPASPKVGSKAPGKINLMRSGREGERGMRTQPNPGGPPKRGKRSQWGYLLPTLPCPDTH